MPTPKAIQTVASRLKLLGDPTRLRILYTLIEQREINVSALCRTLRLNQPAVSHHLSILRLAQLVETRRSGKEIFYALPTGRKRTLKALLSRLETL